MKKLKPPRGIRMPEDLDEMIRISASENTRNWSSEIIHRLYLSFKRKPK